LLPGDKVRLGWTDIEVEMERPVELYEPVQVSEADETIVREDSELSGPQGDPVQSPVEKPSESEETVVREIGGDKAAPIHDAKSKTQQKPKLKVETKPRLKPEPRPAPEGTIVTVTDATRPPFTHANGLVDDTQKQGWLQLRALNDFMMALGPDTTMDDLGRILVEQLKHAIPGAQRGAILLAGQQGGLLLKAHWPHGEHSVSMTWVERAFSRREAFIWSASEQAGSDDTGCDAPKSALYYDVQSAIYLPLLSADEVFGVMYVDNYFTRKAFCPTDFELLRAIANQVAMFLKDHVLRKDLQREEMLSSNLLKQYSPKVANQIMNKRRRLQRGGEQVDPVTVLVSDVRNFTALSAEMEPDEVVRALNEMFDAFVPIINELDGIVDKYVGDSVLAVFGSPELDPNQCEKAVKVALKMQEAMEMISKGRKVRRLPVFQVGIGIHTGELIHGFIGSIDRTEFTVIGDTVNRAARFCDGAERGEIVISKSVYEHIYNLVDVYPKRIRTKHPDVEPDLDAYIVKGLKQNGK
ncbi:MAG: GAF domain-containing protein, partial [Deltaproteobacteria bacterium]|nr:GAF domain-containing protein [Deltaproteobacteria bacterium]